MNILIVKTSSIGDIVQTFGVIQYLKAKFPQAHIDWVVEQEYLELAGSHPAVRRVIEFGSRGWRKKLFSSGIEIKQFIKKLRQEKYDYLFDLQGNTKSSLITAMARAVKKIGFGWACLPERMNFFATHHHIDVDPQSQIQQKYLAVVSGYFQERGDFIPQPFSLKLQLSEKERLKSLLVQHRPRIMIACHSRWINKTLPQETLKAFLAQIAREDDPYFYFTCGNKSERESVEALKVAGRSQILDRLSFPLWQALMEQMDLVIAVDSAALALCGTTKTPSISFFGPTLASVYKPLGNQHRAWQGTCPYNQPFTARCPLLRTCPTGACLKEAPVQALIELYRAKDLFS